MGGARRAGETVFCGLIFPSNTQLPIGCLLWGPWNCVWVILGPRLALHWSGRWEASGSLGFSTGGWNSVSRREENPQGPLCGRRLRWEFQHSFPLPASFRLSYTPPGSDVDSYTHTSPSGFSSAVTRRRGVEPHTSGPASEQCQCPVQGRSTVSTSHSAVNRVCGGGGREGEARGGNPLPPKLCSILEK